MPANGPGPMPAISTIRIPARGPAIDVPTAYHIVMSIYHHYGYNDRCSVGDEGRVRSRAAPAGGYRGEGLCGPAPLLEFSDIGATSVLRRRRATSSLVISIAACLPASPTSLRASTRCMENRSRSATLTRRILGLS